MKKYYTLLALALILFSNCEDNLRDISRITEPITDPIKPINIVPIDINVDGFDFLGKMQGHWVGPNRVIADDYPSFSWDYRAISKSHIHAIFEGGSMGNILTSFFVTDYKNKRTLMARNGGLLNGIYRTSYFVLDAIETLGSDDKKYRFVDAIGSKDIMYFELRFKKDSLYYNAYTSGLGSRIPSRHMTFKGKKEHLSLSNTAAIATGFPQNEIEKNFATGFNKDYLYVKNGATEAKSATFLAQSAVNDVYTLAGESGDPFTITEHPRLGSLLVNITRDAKVKDSNLFVYLSKDPLTDSDGFLTSDLETYNTILNSPTINQKENEFLFTYTHPGDYYVTIVADKNNDATISTGDIVSKSKLITIGVTEHKIITINDIYYQN